MVSGSEASAETRALKLHFIHTGEKAEIVFKRNGVYDQAGLKKINQFLRDWRRNEPTRMDPRLLDAVWEVYRSVGARSYINVVSAYRSPATNSLLRSRSKGVAKKSQHMLGKAMDFFIPGVSLKKLRETGMKMQVGGVGYYPRSGSPFVHMDVGNVRHWPKMSRRELVALFPNGKTLHVPSDGKPLPGYDQAMASYQARKAKGTSALALASTGSKSSSKGFFATLFGGGADEEEDTAESVVAAAPAKKAPPAKVAPPAKAVAKAEPAAEETLPGIRIVSPKDAKRVDLPVAAEEAPAALEPVVETPETIIAALPLRAVPLPEFAPRPKAAVEEVTVAEAALPVPAELASAQAAATETAAPPVPANIPFGMAQADAEALAEAPVAPAETPAAPAAVALDVPLPTPRPGLAPRLAAADAPDAIALAMAADADGPDSAALAAFAAPLPQARPAGAMDLVTVPADRPEMTVGSVTRASDDAVALAAATKAAAERVAALATVADDAPRMATASIAPAEQNTRTTRKAARASAKDGKPDRKAKVVAAEPSAARWVLSGEQVAAAKQATTAPSFAYNAVVTAPREVYTIGFHKGDAQASANRFSGKAVEFLSVARFE